MLHFNADKLKTLISVLFVLSLATVSMAQTITGQTTPCAGVRYSYTFSDDVQYTTTSWSVTGGTIVSGTGNTRSINWSTDGTISVAVYNGATYLYTAYQSVTVKMPGYISGPTLACSGQSFTLNLNATNGTTFTWQQKPVGSGSWTNFGSGGTSQTTSITQNTEFRVSISDCTSGNISNTYTVNLYGDPTGGSISMTSPVCSGSSPGLSSTPIGPTNWSTIQWQRSLDGGSNWTDISGATSLDYNPGALTQATQFRRRVTNSCSTTALSNTVTVQVDPATNPGTLAYSSAATFCASGTVSLNFSASPVGTITNWFVRTKDGSGAWSGWTSFSTVNALTNSYSVVSGSGVDRTYEFYTTVKNGVCTEVATNTVSVVVNPVSSAGGTLSYSGGTVCNTGSITLNLTSAPVGTASWYTRYQNGAGAWSSWSVFSNSNASSNSYTVTSGAGVDRNYEFYVSAQTTTCSAAVGNTISMLVNASSSAGILSYTTPSVMCSTGTVNLSVSNPVGAVTKWFVRTKDGTGAWTAFSQFSTVNALTYSYPVASGSGVSRTYEFYIAAKNGVCSEVTGNTVSMSVDPAASGGTLNITGATEWYGVSGSNTLSTTGAVGSVTYESSGDGSNWTSSGSSQSGLVVTTQFRAKAVSGICPVGYSSVRLIYIYPTPIITLTGPKYIPIGASTLLSTQTNFTSYQWVKDNIDIVGATTSNYTVTEPGSYQVKVKGSASAAWATSQPFIIGSSLLNQLQGTNYMVVTSLYKDGVTETTNFYTLKANEVRQSIQYMDGHGRTLQQNAIGQSPGRKDLIRPFKYDFDGRQEFKYLPYASSQIDGRYVADPFPTQLSFYQTLAGVQSDSYPYAKTVFDNSPLSRVLEQGGPGADWQPGSTHTVRQVFNTINAAFSDAALKNVRRWTTAGPVASPNTYYADNQLGVSTTTDENGNKVWTFSDKLGRAILKRVQLDETLNLNGTNVSTPYLETYYVYDNRGNLAIQIPPKATALINNSTAWSTAFRDQWCFTYTYDERNRLVEKKVPDAAVIYYAYDKLDRLVLTQDGNLRSTNKWKFIKYDIKGRPILTGLYLNATHTTRATIQTSVLDPLYATGVWYEERGTTLHGYTNLSFPTTNYGGTALEVYSVNYYDTYDFDNSGADDYSYTAQGITGEGTQFRSFNLPTGSKTLILGTSTWLYNYVFYDKYGRVIQVRNNNHLSATVNNLATNIYDFEGRLLQSVQYHTNGTTPVTVSQRMEYDHASRLTKVYQKIDAASEIEVAKYEYNEMGQLLDKKLIGPDDSYLQSIDYTYNIRGWLKGINDTQMINSSTTSDNNDLFGLELAYNNVITGLNDQAGDSRYYNGNISASRWRMKVDGTAQYDDQKGYKFNYDKGDRLKAATYRGFKNAAWAHEQDIYNENMTYDHNGNMITLQRNRAKRGSSAFTVISEQIDNLTYTYASGSGNKLTKVEDAISITAGFKNGSIDPIEYTYDANGSMLTDLNKGINGTTYNELGKPTQITFIDGRKIVYTYDGTGNKLTVKNYNGATLLSTSDYIGGFVYENNALNFFGSPEGRVVKNGAAYEYQFAIGDHQNNTRLLYGKAFEGGNLLASQAECTATTGFTANGTVTLSTVTLNSETYVKAVTNQTSGTPGVYPIGGAITVVPGAKYTFKVKGYTEGSNAWLYLWGNTGNLVWQGTVLPAGSANETWVSNEVTIPTGVTQLSTGVLWLAPTAGSTIYLNKVGLYKHNDDDYTAGFEVANQAMEQAQFTNYVTTKINNSSVYARTGTSSYRLTASSSISNEIIGPAKSLRVYTGDVVKMEVYAKYLAPTSTSSGVAAVIASAINAAFGNVAGGGTDAAFQSINSLFTAGPLIGTAAFPAESTTAPKAYLNYILFDDNFVPYDFGYDQVGTAGALPSGLDKMTLEAKARKPGYLYIYLSNENPTTAEVYFDDLSIKHVKSPVIQYNDYYAYGLQTGNSWTRDYTMNNFLYNQSTELNTTSSNYDLFFRNYDPTLARFVQVDPLASKYHNQSTYQYGNADPVYWSDPSGAGGDEARSAFARADADFNALNSIAGGSFMFGAIYNSMTYGSAGGVGGSAFIRYGPGDRGALKSFSAYMGAGARAARENREAQEGIDKIMAFAYQDYSGPNSYAAYWDHSFGSEVVVFEFAEAAVNAIASISVNCCPQVLLPAVEQLLVEVGVLSMTGAILWNGHGNRKDNPNKTKVYKIVSNPKDPLGKPIWSEERTEKFGITSGGKKGDFDRRPKRQVNYMNANYGIIENRIYDYYWVGVARNRIQGLILEQYFVTMFFMRYGEMPYRQRLPIPELLKYD